MAENILKLKVDSTEYTGKVKRAVQGIREMQDACKNVGGTLAVVEKNELQFVQALGQMKTVAKDAKGKIAELNTAFTEASLVYKRLTDEEKKSPFGKALSSSIDQLKGRLNDAKSELASVTGETKKGSSALSELAGKFGLNIGQLTKMAAAIGVTTTATEAFHKYINGSQTATDEWGRTMEATTRVVDGFFESISRGNFDSFISGLNQVIQNARNAYDALDSLSSFNAVSDEVIAKFEERRAKARANIRKGVNVKEAKEELVQIEKEEQLYYNKKSKKERNAGDALIKSLTGTRNGWLIPYFEMDDAGAAQSLAAKEAAKLKSKYYTAPKTGGGKTRLTGTSLYAGGLGASTTAKNNLRSGWASKDLEDKYNALINYSQLSDPQIKMVSEHYAASHNAKTQMWGHVASDARLMNSKGGATGGGGTDVVNDVTDVAKGSIDWYNQEISKLNKELTAATDQEVRVNVQNMIDEYTAAIGKIKSEISLTQFGSRFNTTDAKVKNAEWLSQNGNAQIANKINPDYNPAFSTQLKFKDKSKGKTNGKENNGKDITATEAASQIVGGLSGISSGLQAFGMSADSGFAKVIEKMGAVITIITSIESIVTAIEAISAIGSILPFAHGGVVPAYAAKGRYFQPHGTDTVPAMLTPGETVLTRAMTNNLATQLNGVGMGSMNLTATIKGEDIRLALNNNSRRRGKGEYVTSRV